MRWLGFDIGGANLKAADGRGWARSVPFALWREPNGLAGAIAQLIAAAPDADRLAVTMTGELCDAFRTKSEGVRHIVSAVEQAAAGRDLRMYLIDGRFVTADAARELPHLAAASNWHALARFAARFTGDRPALVIDIGSTTTDVVPIIDGHPNPRAFNDTDRLLAGELVYTGVGRTPVCAITRRLPWLGAQCPVAAELFATAADACLLLGELPEQPHCNSSADGRPLTKEFARERLARMICADATTFGEKDAIRAAAHIRDAQLAELQQAAQRVIATMQRPPDTFVLSGAGEFLARHLIQRLVPESKTVSLNEQLGRDASACAPAHALATLARECCR